MLNLEYWELISTFSDVLQLKEHTSHALVRLELRAQLRIYKRVKFSLEDQTGLQKAYFTYDVNEVEH